MQEILSNRVSVLCVMAFITFAITQGLKWVLVKPWTNRLKSERARKAINMVIFFFPYAIALSLGFLYATFILKGETNALIALIVGGGGHSFYGFFEMIWGVVTGNIKVKRQAQTEEEKAVEDLVVSVAEDGKVNKEENPALNAFLEKVK